MRDLGMCQGTGTEGTEGTGTETTEGTDSQEERRNGVKNKYCFSLLLCFSCKPVLSVLSVPVLSVRSISVLSAASRCVGSITVSGPPRGSSSAGADRAPARRYTAREHPRAARCAPF